MWKKLFYKYSFENISSFAKQDYLYLYSLAEKSYEMYGMVNVFINEISNILEQIKTYATGEPLLIIFDDMINSNSLSDIALLFTVDGRHMNLSMAFLTQWIFVNNEHFRQISQNCDYFCLFKNPRNSSEIRILAQQLTPGRLDLIEIDNQATKPPFSYLFINLTQNCPPELKYIYNMFENILKVYVVE